MKIFDVQARLIERVFSHKWMMRVGVLMIDVSIAFLVYMPFSGEQPGIFLMSQLALLFAGIICVVEAVRAQEESNT